MREPGSHDSFGARAAGELECTCLGPLSVDCVLPAGAPHTLRLWSPGCDAHTVTTVRYRVGPDDIGAFTLATYTRSGHVRRGQMFAAGLYVLGGLLLGALFSTRDPAPERATTVGLFAALGLLLGYTAWRSYPARLLSNMAKAEPPEATSTLYGDFSLTITDESVSIDHELTSSRLKWTAVRELVDTPEHFFVMLSRIRGFTIPKASLTGATPDELKAILSQHIDLENPTDGDPDVVWTGPYKKP